MDSKELDRPQSGDGPGTLAGLTLGELGRPCRGGLRRVRWVRGGDGARGPAAWAAEPTQKPWGLEGQGQCVDVSAGPRHNPVGTAGQWAQGASRSQLRAGAQVRAQTGLVRPDTQRKPGWGPRARGPGDPDPGGHRALTRLVSPAPVAAESQAGSWSADVQEAHGCWALDAPDLGTCRPALTVAGVRPWRSHNLLSCSFHHGPIGFPTGPQLRGHPRTHSGPGLPGVRLLP